MTIGEHIQSPMLTEANELRDSLVIAQLSINEATAAAEMDATQTLHDLGIGSLASEIDTTDIVDIRIKHKEPVISPRLMEHALPLSEQSAKTTSLGRAAIGDILVGTDDRLIVITGPCSIHNGEEAVAYAEKVAAWRAQYGDQLEIVMRAYFEKPRSEQGWKGAAYDPNLNGSHDIDLGLVYTRMIAQGITEQGVPIATERLNASTPQYLNGFVAYDAIGARNIADQKSREYASGTSSPVGMKNATDGSTKDAISAVVSANSPHTFLGTDMAGVSAEVSTTGNEFAHVILRGGNNGPNYSSEHVKALGKKLKDRGLLEAVVIDASHGNSGKVAANQRVVIENIAAQLTDGEDLIKGVMLESNLRHGKQDLESGSDLAYGVSVTDECIDIKETELLLEILANAVRNRRALANAS